MNSLLLTNCDFLYKTLYSAQQSRFLTATTPSTSPVSTRTTSPRSSSLRTNSPPSVPSTVPPPARLCLRGCLLRAPRSSSSPVPRRSRYSFPYSSTSMERVLISLSSFNSTSRTTWALPRSPSPLKRSRTCARSPRRSTRPHRASGTQESSTTSPSSTPLPSKRVAFRGGSGVSLSGGVLAWILDFVTTICRSLPSSSRFAARRLYHDGIQKRSNFLNSLNLRDG